MITRRTTVRLLGLAALATTAATLTGCGDQTSSSASGDDPSIVPVAEVPRAAGSVDGIGAVVTALHALGGGVYARLAVTDGNLALSPYSIGVALAMARNGAAGSTADEMDGVLSITDLDAANGGLNALTQAVEGLAGRFERPDDDPAEIAVDSADALFGDRATTWREEFLVELARDYGAAMHVVDYAHAAPDARTLINQWTAERTHDRIPEIIAPDAVDAMTRLVLVNALYFQAPWATAFEASATADQPFHRAVGDPVDVPTMRGLVESASYAAGDGWQAVRLPYYGGTLAMTVLLPDEGGLEALEASVGRGGLSELLAASQPMAVQLALPRWTFTSTSALKPPLSALGMPTAFDEAAADFSAMTDDGTDLHIDDVAHQAFVAVDEHGTEAAAATAVLMGTTSMPEYVAVTVDRPFLFAIHDTELLAPLFLGRVSDPS